MTISLRFYGAADTVTGSKYLLTLGERKILIDGGLFQGPRNWREKNWSSPPELSTIQAVLVTHAHIDHIGILPRWSKEGLGCPIYCTSPTYDLSALLLPDSGRLQEEEASYRAESGKSRYAPPLPLYTEEDADRVLTQFRTVPFEKPQSFFDGAFTVTWHAMGHILGAASLTIEYEGERLVFSGDIGRYDDSILVEPSPVKLGDLLLIESTYGDRIHPDSQPKKILSDVIRRTAERGGMILIPSFAVGRTQQLLYHLTQLKKDHQIPDLPIIIDSPMARDATSIYVRYQSLLNMEVAHDLRNGIQPFTPPGLRFVRDRNQSIALNDIHEPMILISASGMLTGGRILHHLKHRISDPRNTILFVGFQPPESLGDKILRGDETVRFFKSDFEVRAQVTNISSLSAHADRDELLRWCRSCEGIPKKVMVVHGEPVSASRFAETLRNELKWNVEVAHYLDEISF